MELKRTKQCKTCPWKKDADPFDIPDGYSVELHKKLSETIAEPGSIGSLDEIKIMACHYSKDGQEEHCIGWLENQLGPGNNIALRISMMVCTNSNDIETFGEQHREFKDTLPGTNGV